MQKVTRKFIYNNTVDHRKESKFIVGIMLIFDVIVMFKCYESIDKNIGLVKFIAILNIFVIFGILLDSRGYFIDIILMNTKSIEGESKLLEAFSVAHEAAGNVIEIKDASGKKKKLKYYYSVRRCSSPYEKSEKHQKIKEVYYYLGLSKVIFYVDYIPYETDTVKNKRNNKH